MLCSFIGNYKEQKHILTIKVNEVHICECTSVHMFALQHSCPHGGRCVPGGDGGSSAPHSPSLHQDQSAPAVGREHLPHQPITLCLHPGGLCR